LLWKLFISDLATPDWLAAYSDDSDDVRTDVAVARRVTLCPTDTMHTAISALTAQRSTTAVPVYAEATGAYCGLLGWRHVVSALAQREQQHRDKDSVWGSTASDAVAKQVSQTMLLVYYVML
jgi:hypothetical protein